MQIQKKTRVVVIACLTIFFIACNNSKNGKDTSDKAADTAVTATTAPVTDKVTDTAPKTATQKCYSNEGLKYSTIITINYISDTNVTGKVMSKEMDSDKNQVANFTGSVSGDKLIIKFDGIPPVIGDASDWTSQPWTRGNKSGKESLRIVFNAKNYETNKWADTDYEFGLVECK